MSVRWYGGGWRRRFHRPHTVHEPGEARRLGLRWLRLPARKRGEVRAMRTVGISARAIDHAVMAAPQPPHAVMEVGIEMAMPDDVANRMLAAA